MVVMGSWLSCTFSSLVVYLSIYLPKVCLQHLLPCTSFLFLHIVVSINNSLLVPHRVYHCISFIHFQMDSWFHDEKIYTSALVIFFDCSISSGILVLWMLIPSIMGSSFFLFPCSFSFVVLTLVIHEFRLYYLRHIQ